MSKYPIVCQVRRVGLTASLTVNVVRQTLNIKALENCLFYIVQEPDGVKLDAEQIETAILVAYPHLKDRGLYEWTGRKEVMTDDELEGMRRPPGPIPISIERQTRDDSQTLTEDDLSDAIEVVRESLDSKYLAVFAKRGEEELYARRGECIYLNRLGA